MTTTTTTQTEQALKDPALFTPTPRQLEVWNFLKSREPSQGAVLLGYGGAMGGGKTRTLVELAIETALAFPGTRILIGRLHYTDLSATTMREFFLHCPPELIVDRRRAQPETVSLRSGQQDSDPASTIQFRQLRSWRGLGSEQYGAVLVDEAGEVPEQAARMLLTRLRHPAQPFRYFVAASNPWPGWFERWFVRRELPDDRLKDANIRLGFIPARIRDNPHLPPHYEQMQRLLLPDDWVDRFVEGKFESLLGLVYANFDRQAHRWTDALPPFAAYVGGIDFGGLAEHHHHTAAVVAGLTAPNAPCGGGVLIRLDEFEDRGPEVITRLDAWTHAKLRRAHSRHRRGDADEDDRRVGGDAQRDGRSGGPRAKHRAGRRRPAGQPPRYVRRIAAPGARPRHVHGQPDQTLADALRPVPRSAAPRRAHRRGSRRSRPFARRHRRPPKRRGGVVIAGALLALASSFSFSVNSILVRRGFADAGATAAQGAFITVLLGVPFGLIAVLLTGQIFNFGLIPLDGYLYLSAAGVVHYGVGRYCNYRGIAAIGAARAVTVQAVAVPYSILMAVILLDERPSLPMYAAIALILVGPSLMIERRPKRPAAPAGGSGAAAAPDVEIRQLEGYVFSLLAALAYGTSPILIRAAVEDASATAAIGTLVSYAAASAVLIAALALPAQRELVHAINFRYMRLFGGAGLSVFLAQLFRFFALSFADVSVVNPLMRTVGVFTLILSYFVNRSLERITLGVVLGVLVSFGGAALLIAGAALRLGE